MSAEKENITVSEPTIEKSVLNAHKYGACMISGYGSKEAAKKDSYGNHIDEISKGIMKLGCIFQKIQIGFPEEGTDVFGNDTCYLIFRTPDYHKVDNSHNTINFIDIMCGFGVRYEQEAILFIEPPQKYYDIKEKCEKTAYFSHYTNPATRKTIHNFGKFNPEVFNNYLTEIGMKKFSHRFSFKVETLKELHKDLYPDGKFGGFYNAVEWYTFKRYFLRYLETENNTEKSE